jgi:hypothetical protein
LKWAVKQMMGEEERSFHAVSGLTDTAWKIMEPAIPARDPDAVRFEHA